MNTEERVQKFFNVTASDFDSLYGEEKSEAVFNKLFRKAMVQRVQFSVEACAELGEYSLLDIGCGSARNIPVFVKGGAKKVVGIDFADEMLVLAEQQCKALGLDHVSFTNGDFMKHDFDEKFDVTLALGVFDYLMNPEEFLNKMVSLTNKKVIFSIPEVSLLRMPLRKLRYALRGCPLRFYTKASATTLCEQANFKSYELVPLSGGYLVVGNC